MTRYFVGIGSNEKAVQNCAAMIRAVCSTFQSVCVSSVVRTPACGVDAPNYLNAVVSFEASLSLSELHRWCKALEKQLGRTRNRKGVCEADLDILEPGQVSEAFFQPLILQVQAFLEGTVSTVNLETVALQLDEQMRVGDAPCYFSQN
ncbi:hypothetical protein GZ77_20820 [Endozoicomonas montiporae]|uniref:2-amino-4-hydroxy-6-hydroxymethyldihydropteridine pyrophosphokinase n=2 Tax=Endozoicomonas montiporae TaxID=1027273 RepID=A0A081N362_9GAMM|nr:2-amino-4-hydroxy-6-hydroxymethyldihydropteridine diphosphokinase [Endozoicomonas montiporae]AMO58177.1 2-amino-4-hydroxy-6-hydroxymethyldihydropteridine pyrophosphokinase [Endozoicomonas montiporae CL-33]KEQ12885.1 hypothetical protein GZ77_20820 [Endozoicomonas montiporae]